MGQDLSGGGGGKTPNIAMLTAHKCIHLEYWKGHHEIDSGSELDSSGDTERKIDDHYDYFC